MRPMWRLLTSLVLTSLVLLAEVIVSHFSHSLTLLSLVNHSLYNVISLSVSVASRHLRDADGGLKATFGWARFEVLGSLSSLVFLFSLTFASCLECLQTMVHAQHLDAMHHPVSIAVVAAAHFGVAVVVVGLVGGYTKVQSQAMGKTAEGGVKLRMPSSKSFLRSTSLIFRPQNVSTFEVCRDFLDCILLLLLTCSIHFLQPPSNVVQIVDPLLSLATSVLIASMSWNILRESCLILLQTIPARLDVDQLKREIYQRFPHQILNIHNMHVWSLVPGEVVATMHVLFTNKESYLESFSCIEEFLLARGITHSAVQPEIPDDVNMATFNNVDQNTENSDHIVVNCSLLGEDACLLQCKNCKATKGNAKK